MICSNCFETFFAVPAITTTTGLQLVQSKGLFIHKAYMQTYNNCNYYKTLQISRENELHVFDLFQLLCIILVGLLAWIVTVQIFIHVECWFMEQVISSFIKNMIIG